MYEKIVIGLFLLACLIIAETLRKWKEKADKYDNLVSKNHDENYVPNFEEIKKIYSKQGSRDTIDYAFNKLKYLLKLIFRFNRFQKNVGTKIINTKDNLLYQKDNNEKYVCPNNR